MSFIQTSLVSTHTPSRKNMAGPWGLPLRAGLLALLWCAVAWPIGVLGQSLQSNPPAAVDALVQDMAQAYRKGDTRALTAALPRVKGHILEPWVAYWELALRLESATGAEVDAFLNRYTGTYVQDRLRNDYLLLLGQRRDWQRFSKYHPEFRMQDDTQVRCYALVAQYIQDLQPIAQQVSDIWLSQRDADDACTTAMTQQYKLGKVDAAVMWRRARIGMEANRPKVVQAALEILNPEWAETVAKIYAEPEKFLEGKILAIRPRTRELVTLALVRLAANDVAAAREQVAKLRWRSQLTEEERSWVWAVIGKEAALNLSDAALDDFANAKDTHLSDDLLAWKARAALRASNAAVLLATISHMSAKQQADPTWVYWRATMLTKRDGKAAPEAQALFKSIAGPIGFYEQLAMAELGQAVSTPAPAPLDPAEVRRAEQNPGLRRAIAAIALGLRSEGVREWNYTTNLHDKGGMTDPALRGAAQVACDLQLWDRCINTSDRTRQVVDWAQRYPMPLRQAVVQRSQEIDLDPAYVYGLIRQESRFVVTARSGVGASGLMQVMPATARWTAKKIGLTGFTVDQLHQESVNIAIGTAYLKLVLDEFEGHRAMAAGAYNAGPSRVRNWRLGPELEAAAWIENIPFTETRDYVKKVTANAVVYAALLTGQPQSPPAHLPNIGPRKSQSPLPDASLP